MIYVGIDPGLTGAIGVIRPDGSSDVIDIATVETSKKGAIRRMIDADQVANALCFASRPMDAPVTVVLEKTSAAPGQGVASMFSMGDSFGVLRGVLAGLNMIPVLVRPARWKKDMGLPSDKEVCRQRALELFPGMAAQLGRKKDHNRAEALLLALWATGKGRESSLICGR